MPKIIENLREQLLAEARLQIEERGYAETTVRSVARAVGVGVGTVYNYFESKEMLIASFVFESWKKYLKYMSELPTDDARALLFGIYTALREFADENKKLFSDAAAAGMPTSTWSERHKMLRGQISSFISPITEGDGFLSEFLAESLICWSVEGRDFNSLYPILEKSLKK